MSPASISLGTIGTAMIAAAVLLIQSTGDANALPPPRALLPEIPDGPEIPPESNPDKTSDYYFTGADGKQMMWKRVAPGYGAWALDRRSADGPIVFTGVEDTVEGMFESNECESVGCHVYRIEADGSVKKLFSEQGGFGINDVALSRSGGRVTAAALDTDSSTRYQGRIWSYGGGVSRGRTITGQAFTTAADRASSFSASAGTGKVLVGPGTGKWALQKPGPSCAFYSFDFTGPRALFAGWSGTYKIKRNGKAKKIGVAADAVWSSKDGATVVISPISSSAQLRMSTDHGRHWRDQQLVDNVGEGACDNSSQNQAGDCNDNVAGARLDIRVIAASGPKDIWAVGGRADIPGGRVYRYTGNDRWERVRFPSDIWWASDAVVLENGRPLVASMGGIMQAEPVS